MLGHVGRAGRPAAPGRGAGPARRSSNTEVNFIRVRQIRAGAGGRCVAELALDIGNIVNITILWK